MIARVQITALVLAALSADCSNAQKGGEPTLAVAPETSDSELERADEQPLEQLLGRRVKKYAQGMLADGPSLHGELREGARADQLLVLRGGFCYRILGVGGPNVQDMDLFLYDPNGVQTHQDPNQDRYPVLGKQAELCPAASGAYRLQTLMYKGGGPYLIGVYRTP